MRRLIGRRRPPAAQRPAAPPAAPPPEPATLAELPRAELYRMARDRHVPNAVRLTREQLIEALGGDPPQPSEPTVEGPPPPPSAPAADLDRLPRPELFRLAQERRIADAVRMSREALIAVLRPHPAPAASSRAPAQPAAAPDGLEELSRQELFARARERGIPGTLTLSREELIAALRGAPPAPAHPEAVPSPNGASAAVPPAAGGGDALDELSRSELFWLARRHEVDHTLTLSRDELVAALRRAGVTGAEPPAPPPA
jgi:hypothetical protein